MPNEIAKAIKELEEELCLAEKTLQKTRIRINEEIRQTMSLCAHRKQERQNISAGCVKSQQIVCLDCEQILQSGQHLFPVRKADKNYHVNN